MKKVLVLLFALTICYHKTYGQGDADLPIIEDFENEKDWMWAPWINAGNGSSTKTKYAAHKSKFGLRCSNEPFFRTDKVYGTPGQVISWWIRFVGPSRARCGFGIADFSRGFYLCVDPSTNTLHFANTPDYTNPMLKSVPQTYKMNMWYRVEIVFNTSTNITARLYKSDGVSIMNTITHTIPELTPGGIAFRGDGNGFVHLDDIKGGNRIPKSATETHFAPKAGERIILNNIQFENNKSILLQQSFTELDKLVQYLKYNPNTKIEISGHTDNTGNEEHNKDLSEARAKAVATYLIQKGIDKTRILSAGFGSSKPITTNNTAEGRQKNRRVEFMILKN